MWDVQSSNNLIGNLKKKVYILNAKHGVSFKVLVFILIWRQYYIFDDTEFLTTFLSIKKAQENNYRKNPVNQSKKIGLLIMVIFGSTLTVRLCGVNPSMKKKSWLGQFAGYLYETKSMPQNNPYFSFLITANMKKKQANEISQMLSQAQVHDFIYLDSWSVI